MFVAFIRHGQYAQPANTPSAWLPQPLTADGRAQSVRAAELVMAFSTGFGLSVAPEIDCSRLRRAWETARTIATTLSARLGSEFIVAEFEAMAERSVGAFANLTLEQIEQHVADDPRYDRLPANWKSQSYFKLPAQGAESLMEAGSRVRAHVAARIDGLSDTQLKLFVGHGAALRHAAHLLGLLSFEEIAGLSMFNAHPVIYEQRGGEWSLAAGEWKVRTRGDRPD